MGARGSFQLARLFGIRIGVDASWFLILFLAIFFLQRSFQETLGGSDTTAYAAAVGAAFCFFGSIVLHELGHALVARREGIGVTGIDLFFFGGLMRMSRDTDSPGAEFRVAIAGPAVTAVIAALALGVASLIAGSLNDAWRAATLGQGDIGVVLLISAFIGTMNLGLLVFNLIPAFPLDGGRIARAAVWRITGDRNRATRLAARVGQGFAWLVIGFGLFLVVAGAVYDGIWLALLGWLLGQAAKSAVTQSVFAERIGDITVADIMDTEPVTIPADITAARAYEDYFLRYHGWRWFAVVEEDGRFVGRADRAPVELAAGGGESERLMRDLVGRDPESHVPTDTPLETLLGSDALRRLGALMAVDAAGRLRGVVTLEQVSQALRARLVAPT